MAFNLKELNLSDKTVMKVTDFLKEMWFGIPIWLRNLLVVVVVIGGGYFVYTRVIMSYDMDNLQYEVKSLAEKYETSVIYDRYIYDITNLIEVNQNLENEIDLMYYYHEETMKIVMEFMKNHHDHDPAIDAMERMHEMVRREKEAYDRTLQYHISIYKDWHPKAKNTEDPVKKISGKD